MLKYYAENSIPNSGLDLKVDTRTKRRKLVSYYLVGGSRRIFTYDIPLSLSLCYTSYSSIILPLTFLYYKIRLVVATSVKEAIESSSSEERERASIENVIRSSSNGELAIIKVGISGGRELRRYYESYL
ncbi:hypothetical protein BDZ85DRAFT_252864 [Elsinoe ampelina]|uniref:Uncharacterized protein n=1 Tax=Elsinoe ampelina TaxID=302913 RepID=A0A6A6G0V0_9PEZI|nr:hypothetical protein BDZ85DRAFT_252864 [Elsinoe ampelina]